MRSITSPNDHQILQNDLTRIQSIKYLGLTISHNLPWSPHISRIVSKVNQAQSFFQRNLSYCSRDLKVKCYQTYICPIIEYAAVKWSPHTLSDIHIVRCSYGKQPDLYSRFSSVNNMYVRTFRIGHTLAEA